MRRESRQCEKPIMNRKLTIEEFPQALIDEEEIRKSTLFKRITRSQLPLDLIYSYFPDYDVQRKSTQVRLVENYDTFFSSTQSQGPKEEEKFEEVLKNGKPRFIQ